MMVRFDSKASTSLSMFEKDARHMLPLMGHSDTIPSAIRGEDIAATLQTFQAALKALTEQEQGKPMTIDSEEDEPPVPINRRAWPLLELLTAAAARKEAVMWDFDHRLL